MNQLSDDVLEGIFAYLDCDSLKNVSKASKRFFEIIKVSPILMKKFTLELTSNNLRHEITIVDPFPCGWHQNLKIINFDADFIIIKQILFKHKNSLTNIEIYQSNVRNILNSLATMQNLKRLTIENCNIGNDHKFDQNLKVFPMLKELNIVKCDVETEKVFSEIKESFKSNK